MISDENFNGEFWIRTPLIPGATATKENLRAIAGFVAEKLGAENISRWELCSFNNSCIGKYNQLGIKWSFEGVHLIKKAEISELRSAVEEVGFPAEKLFTTGIIAD